MIFWNKNLETMPRDELTQLQFRRFKNMFTFAYENSPAYRKLYEESGITPADLKGFEDISKVPIISKKFITENLEGSLYGSTLAVKPENVAYYHQTSGTTSKPVPQPDNLFDWYYNGECWANALWAHGLRKSDRVLVAFNYNFFIGFWQCHYGCEKIGAEIVSGGSLPTEVKIQKIYELGITALATTPSYAFHMAEKAHDMGYDLANSPIRILVTAGEPGGLVPSVKGRLQKLWGADVFDNAGATEVGAWGFECTAGSGGLHINEACFLPEIIGIEDEQPITEPGVYGRLVLTNFFRSARPCIRFNTNDIACWSKDPCPCGRTYRMLEGGIQGRVDHILKVRGTFVNPIVIEDIINGYEKCTQEYTITIYEDNNRILVTAEAAKGISEEEYPDIAEEIKKRIHNATFVKMEVKMVPCGTMERSDAKSKRIIDLRKGRKEWTSK